MAVSLAAPRRIFAKQPRRPLVRGLARLGAALAVMMLGAGGGALLAASLGGPSSASQQVAVQR